MRSERYPRQADCHNDSAEESLSLCLSVASGADLAGLLAMCAVMHIYHGTNVYKSSLAV